MKNRYIQMALKLFGAKAEEVIANPKKMDRLIQQAKDKMQERRGPKRVLQGFYDELRLMFELLKAYHSGRYRKISVRSMVLVVFAMIYFVVPTDIIPDFILGFGFIDDSAVVLWAIGCIRSEIEKFRLWLASEQEQRDEDREL